MSPDPSLESIPGVGSTRGEALRAAGYRDVDAVASAAAEDLRGVSSVGPETALAIREAAKQVRGDDDTLAARLATDLGIDRTEVRDAYAALAPLGVPPDDAERPLRTYFDGSAGSVLHLDAGGLRYRYLLYADGYRTVADVADAALDDLADVPYFSDRIAEQFRSAARERRSRSSSASGSSASARSSAASADRASSEAASPTPKDGPSESGSGGTESGSATAAEPDHDWAGLFPFEIPYEQQATGIDEFLDVLADNGWYAMEGACGTGKTLVALVGGIYAVRNDRVDIDGAERSLPPYDRVLAVTPVKQQLRQFVAEVRAINRNRPSGEPPVPGLVLRGMGDLLAFARADGFDVGRELDRAFAQAGDEAAAAGSLQRQVHSLRRTAGHLITEGSPVDLDWNVEPPVCSLDDCRRYTDHTADDRCPIHRSDEDGADGADGEETETSRDDPWYDPVRADRVVELWREADGARLTVDGTETPYPAEIPRVRDVVSFGTDPVGVSADAPFDPFHVHAVTGVPDVEFAAGEDHVLDGDALVRVAAAAGYCPHTAMGELLPEAEVVVGNYTHLFDPETRGLTREKGRAIDRRTVAVVDEAHVTEGRARELLSERASLADCRRAATDVERVLDVLDEVTMAPPGVAQRARRTAAAVLGSRDIEREDLLRATEFLSWAVETAGDLVADYLAEEYRDWRSAAGAGRPPSDEVPLQAPRSADTDRLTKRLRDSPFDERWVRRLDSLGAAVAEILGRTDVTERETVVEDVGRLFARWVSEDSVAYFREVDLEHSPGSGAGSGVAAEAGPESSRPAWTDRLSATLVLFNCIPDRQLARIYNELGGGISMSATLEPLDAFTAASGLAAFREGVDGGFDAGDDMTDGEHFEGGRRVDTATYGLAFPEANRASFTVTLPPFTYANRGSPTDRSGDPVTDYDSMSSVRQQYHAALTTLADSHGNVLVAMPNYTEARWAAAVLDRAAEKRVFLDQSSAAGVTTDLLADFFATDGAVLVTSCLGTVTEGVDYDGDKLHTAAVVGVPFRNTQVPRTQATVEAYDRCLGSAEGSGFDLAVGIPAVRKARQAIGRVLRSPDEVGVRAFLDRRYAGTGRYDVGRFLSRQEYEEFRTVDPDMFDLALERFWDGRV